MAKTFTTFSLFEPYQSNPSTAADLRQNPAIKIAGDLVVRFYKKNGKACLPHQAYEFALKLPGQRKTYRYLFDPQERKTTKTRLTAIAQIIIDYSKERAKSRSAREAKRIKKAMVKAKALQKKTPKKVKAEVKKHWDQVQEEVFKENKIEKRPALTPKLDQLVTVSSEEKKYVLGRDIYAKHKHRKSRAGIADFVNRTMTLEKLHVDLDPKKPIEVYDLNAKAVALSLREYFRPFAADFVDKMRGNSEEAYILRVKTVNKMEGEKPRAEGIGTERFRIANFIPKDRIKHLRLEYPGLSDAQILREEQMIYLDKKLKDLFDYFVQRTETYLARRLMASMAVTGFSMEVVKSVMKPNHITR